MIILFFFSLFFYCNGGHLINALFAAVSSLSSLVVVVTVKVIVRVELAVVFALLLVIS